MVKNDSFVPAIVIIGPLPTCAELVGSVAVRHEYTWSPQQSYVSHIITVTNEATLPHASTIIFQQKSHLVG